MMSHFIDQAGLEFLGLSDPLTLASQSAGITDVGHCAWPQPILFLGHASRAPSVMRAEKHQSLLHDRRTGAASWGAGGKRSKRVKELKLLHCQEPLRSGTRLANGPNTAVYTANC
ncbi:hypothetical protein AAY473_009482 [Plecturocebus cupreus]